MDIANADLGETKQALRRTMRLARSRIPDRQARTARLREQLVELCRSIEASAGRTVHVLAFAGVGNEPDTTDLLAQLQAGGHRVLLPRVDGDHFDAVDYRVADELRSGAYGILEPSGPAVDPATIDLVIVPGLAFTLDGGRLGQGGGFYDRYLAHVRPDCLTCGVGFAEQIVPELPLEPHDQRLTLVITA